MESWIFVVLATIFWGLAPIFGKLGLESMGALTGVSLRSWVISLILLLVGVGTGSLGDIAHLSTRSIVLIFAEGIFAGLLGHFSYFLALKAGEVSRIAPLVMTYPVITFLTGVLFLGESWNYTKIGGVALIVVGAILLNL